MAIRYGTLNGGGGGDLWKLNGAAPNTISLNNIAGVTGIVAPFPGDSDLEMRFSEPVPGQKDSGFVVYETATKIMYAGARKSPTEKNAVVLAQDVVSGKVASFFSKFSGLGNPICGVFVSDAVSAECSINYEATQTDCVVEDTATGDSSLQQQTVDAKEINIFKAGVEVFRFRIDENGLALYNNAGADLLLQIADTGEILTNQTEAATAIDTTIVGRFPVHDETGTLIGYAPLMVNP